MYIFNTTWWCWGYDRTLFYPIPTHFSLVSLECLLSNSCWVDSQYCLHFTQRFRLNSYEYEIFTELYHIRQSFHLQTHKFKLNTPEKEGENSNAMQPSSTKLFVYSLSVNIFPLVHFIQNASQLILLSCNFPAK